MNTSDKKKQKDVLSKTTKGKSLTVLSCEFFAARRT